MKNKGLSYLLGGIFAVLFGILGFGGNYVSAASCSENCDGIKLNTCFPIIGNCIGGSGESSVDSTNAFPAMIGALTKIAVSLVLVVCFIIVIYAGILWAGAGDSSSKVTEAKKWLGRVAITVLLLGFSGAILRLINPNFFT